MRLYDVVDDYGVWIVTQKWNGRWVSEEQAQDECNRRNFAAGISDEDGELKTSLSEKEEDVFAEVHYKHPECTCKPGVNLVAS